MTKPKDVKACVLVERNDKCTEIICALTEWKLLILQKKRHLQEELRLVGNTGGGKKDRDSDDKNYKNGKKDRDTDDKKKDRRKGERSNNKKWGDLIKVGVGKNN